MDVEFADAFGENLVSCSVPNAYVHAAIFMQEAHKAGMVQVLTGCHEDVLYYKRNGTLDEEKSRPWSFLRPQMMCESRRVQDHAVPAVHFMPRSETAPAYHTAAPMHGLTQWALRDIPYQQNTTVTEIAKRDNKYSLKIATKPSVGKARAEEGWEEFDAVIVTCPGPQAYNLLEALVEEKDDVMVPERLKDVYDPVVTAMIKMQWPENMAYGKQP